MKIPLRVPLLCIALLTMLIATPRQLHAQNDKIPDAQASVNDAWLSIHVDPVGRARFGFGVPLRVTDRGQLEQSLSQALKFPVHFNPPITPAPDEEEELDEYADEKLEASNYWTTIDGEGLNAFSDTGLKSWFRIDLEPLLATLKAQDIERLNIWVMFEDRYEVKIPGTQPLNVNGHGYLSFYKNDVDVRSPQMSAIEFAKGYGVLDILIKTTPLLLFLFLPALWIVGRSLSAPKFVDRPAELWGKHLGFLHRLLFALWVIWLPVFAFSGLQDLLVFFLLPYGTRVIQFVVLLFYFLPLIGAMFLCHFASARIYRYVHAVDWSPRKVVRRVIWLNVFSLMPLFVLVLIINALGESLRQAALYAIVGFVAWLILSHSVANVWGSKLHALTCGELRDRIFELARQAGVMLKQIYVLPEDQAQLSNAFARSDDSVMISASLIKNLSRREVDAIMAHEIGHLKEKHPHASNTVMLVVMIATNTLGMILHKVIDSQHSLPIVFSASLALGSLVVFFVSRKNERRADAIGISLTGDPEAFLSGFAKLSRLNLMPLHSGGWGESLETHPRSMRRLAELANAHGISPERLHSLITDTPTTVGSTYPFIEKHETETIFSSDFKTKYRVRYALTICAVLVLAPIPFAWVLDQLGSPLWISVTAAAGLIFCFGAGQLIRNRLIYWGQGSFSLRLRETLEKRGLSEIAKHGTLVGLAPAAESRKFEEYKFWDIGLVWVTREKLYYFGERIQFALDRSEITGVCVGDAEPEWLPEKNLYVSWRNSQFGNNVMHFVAAGQSSLLNGRRVINSLHKQLEAWLNKSDEFPSSPISLASAVGPTFPEITSAPSAIQSSKIVTGVTMLTWFAAVIGFAIGFSFRSIAYMAAVVLICALIEELPKAFRRPHKTRHLTNAPFGGSPAQTYQVGSWAESNAATPTSE